MTFFYPCRSDDTVKGAYNQDRNVKTFQSKYQSSLQQNKITESAYDEGQNRVPYSDVLHNAEKTLNQHMS